MQDTFAGWHLAYDAIVHPDHAEKLGDVAFLERAILDLVELLEMEVLVPPTFKEVALAPTKVGEPGDDGGVTGTCVITTSHVSVHTWPLRQRFCLDVFSCREFGEREVRDFLWERFNVKRRSSHWLKRLWP